VPKEKRTKMEPYGKKRIFVGYSETSKAFKIYVLGQRHIEVSRDVTFHEEVAFKQSKELHFMKKLHLSNLKSCSWIQKWRNLKSHWINLILWIQ
jgi:hypothetical protein